MPIDYSKAAQTSTPTKDELEQVIELAREQYRMEQNIQQLKTDLQQLSGEYMTMRTETLPSKMKELGINELALDNGAKITIKDDINCNIKEENKPEAFKWLRGHGHGDIIKNQLTLLFGMGDDSEKDVAVDFAEQNGYDYTLKEAIHPGTLNAWAREQLESGKDQIPEDIITVFRMDVAKIQLPKPPRKKR